MGVTDTWYMDAYSKTSCREEQGRAGGIQRNSHSSLDPSSPLLPNIAIMILNIPESMATDLGGFIG